MINGNLDPLGRRSTTKAKANREPDDATELPGGHVDNRVSFAHSGGRYSTAILPQSSAAIPAVLLGSPQWVMSFGDKIRKARGKITQAAVAEAMVKTGLVENFSKGALSQWENNRTTPDLPQFIAFCSVTGASADELLLNRKLQGLEKRIGALPEPLREFVIQALQLAEEAKPHIPSKFLTAPTKQTYPAFFQYLLELSQTLRPK